MPLDLFESLETLRRKLGGVTDAGSLGDELSTTYGPCEEGGPC